MAIIAKDWLKTDPPTRILTAWISQINRQALSFEDALAQLETIVESMESGDVPLAALLAKFEEGGKLLKHCETRLKDAELKIEQLQEAKGWQGRVRTVLIRA